MVELMIMMAVITVVMAPSMIGFSGFTSLSELPNYSTAMYTLGNIGGASSICNHATFMSTDTSIKLECGAGTLINLDATASI